MCEACLEKYKDLDPTIEPLMDSITNDLIEIIKKVDAGLPKGTIKTGGIILATGQTFNFDDGKPADMPDADWKELLDKNVPTRRALVAAFIAGYIGFRFATAGDDDPTEEMALFHGCETTLASGANLGHLMREALHMTKDRAN